MKVDKNGISEIITKTLNKRQEVLSGIPPASTLSPEELVQRAVDHLESALLQKKERISIMSLRGKVDYTVNNHTSTPDPTALIGAGEEVYDLLVSLGLRVWTSSYCDHDQFFGDGAFGKNMISINLRPCMKGNDSTFSPPHNKTKPVTVTNMVRTILLLLNI